MFPIVCLGIPVFVCYLSSLHDEWLNITNSAVSNIMIFLFPHFFFSIFCCVCNAGSVPILLTLSCFFVDAAPRSRGAENLLAFLLSMLYERSRYRIKVNPVVQACCPPHKHPWPLCPRPTPHLTPIAGLQFLCHSLRIVGNLLSINAWNFCCFFYRISLLCTVCCHTLSAYSLFVSEFLL